jgi:hypothetical protein
MFALSPSFVFVTIKTAQATPSGFLNGHTAQRSQLPGIQINFLKKYCVDNKITEVLPMQIILNLIQIPATLLS